ncbi:MAG TPA: universal stress protein [Rhodopila sp.]
MFKYILVPVTGADTDAPVFATALAVARLSAAHLVFLHVRTDSQQILTAMAGAADMGGAIDPTAIEELERYGAERQKKAERAFHTFCEREELPVPGVPSLDRPSAEWRLEIGDEARLLAENGRAADIIVTGRRAAGEEAVAAQMLEAALMATGRPVLIPPAEAPVQLTATVAIAWKPTAEAARAVAAARPFIEMADRVIIFSVEEGIELNERSCEKLRDALSWHNPNVSIRILQPERRTPAATLLIAVREANASLLVMGGYGHTRIRELVFGGFTRHVMDDADLAVLMAH